MSSPVDREIRLALWKLHILHHATRRPVYGLWLLEELAEHGHRLSPGTLYPALARMEKNGWLASTGDVPHARARRTYRITSEGRRLLAVLRREVSELHEELVLGHEPEPTGLDRCSMRTRAKGAGRSEAVRSHGRPHRGRERS
jgi:DNA-binding PadR family transcriptional regulator